MTTGRINQVTILIQVLRKAICTGPTPQKRGGTLLQGLGSAQRQTQPRALPAQAQEATQGYSFAPTEFLKEWSTAGCTWVLKPPYTAAYTPQVEGTRPRINTQRRLPDRASPQKSSGIVVIDQLSTDPEVLPTSPTANRTSVFSCESSTAPTEAGPTRFASLATEDLPRLRSQNYSQETEYASTRPYRALKSKLSVQPQNPGLIR